MAHSFVAFVDESGSEGNPDTLGGFEFIILSAVVFRASNIQFTTEIWDRARRILTKPPNWYFGDFKKMNSDSNKYLIASLISQTPIQFCSVMMHKPSHTRLGENYGDLYLYASQLLLERISWICRDAYARSAQGDGTARIIFSERKSLRADRFREYAGRIQSGDCLYRSNAEWRHIRLNQIEDREHRLCDGLKVADFIAASFGSAVEANKKFGLTDDRFIVQVMPRAYRPRNGSVWTNGVKLHPTDAEASLLREDRFRWVSTHCR